MKLNIIYSTILGLTSISALAGTMGTSEPLELWYLTGGAGYSASEKINIKVDPTIWDFAEQGYSNNMGSTGVVFFGVGRYLTNYLRLDARYEHRGNYNFSKFQTGANTGTPNFTSTIRMREFQLDSNAVMATAWLDLGHLSNRLLWRIYQNIFIEPFFGIGLGVDYLNVKNFKTKKNPYGPRPYIYGSVNQTNTGSSFAWHTGAGLQAKITERTTLAVGYNYFDGGSIPFPTYLLASPTNFTASTIPWEGSFRANEVYGELRVTF